MLPVKSAARSLMILPLLSPFRIIIASRKTHWSRPYAELSPLGLAELAAAASYLGGNPLRFLECVDNGLELATHTIDQSISFPLDPRDVVGRGIVEILIDCIGILFRALPERDIEPIMRGSQNLIDLVSCCVGITVEQHIENRACPMDQAPIFRLIVRDGSLERARS